MIALIQKVKSASVAVENQTIATIPDGLLILLGIAKNDSETDSNYLIEKITNLRIFPSFDSAAEASSETASHSSADPSSETASEIRQNSAAKARTSATKIPQKHFDRTIKEVQGAILLVSQFTLCANFDKGRRPDFSEAARAEFAKPIYEQFIQKLKAAEIKVETGKFGAMMDVNLVNDGPVTLILNSKDGEDRYDGKDRGIM